LRLFVALLPGVVVDRGYCPLRCWLRLVVIALYCDVVGWLTLFIVRYLVIVGRYWLLLVYRCLDIVVGLLRLVGYVDLHDLLLWCLVIDYAVDSVGWCDGIVDCCWW